MNTTPPILPEAPATPLAKKIHRRNRVTLKLLFIAALVLLLQIPLVWVHALQQERKTNRSAGVPSVAADARPGVARPVPAGAPAPRAEEGAFETYRMVERALKHGFLVLALVFTAFFLFETLGGLRLHPVHYGLVGAALCLFYLALLALGEVIAPGAAYVVAATASSGLIVAYSVAILRSPGRAGVIATLLTGVHGVLYVVLRMENFALLAGTAALFVALGAVMFFTRDIDWYAQETAGPEAAP